MKTQNILIPTDFSIASLMGVDELLNSYPDEKFNVSLVHFMRLSDSITELLMLSRRASEYRHVSPEFEEQFNNLRVGRKDQLVNMTYEFFYGSTIAVFKNFLEAKGINSIVRLQGLTFTMLTRHSVDPQLFIDRSGYPVIELPTVAPLTFKTAVANSPDVVEMEEA